MEFKVISRSKVLKEYIEFLMPKLIKELNLTNSRKYVLIEVAKGITGDVNAMGATTNLPGLDSYIIALKPQRWNDLGSTLAHEMVHVKQFAKGQLTVKNNTRYWMGKRVHNRTAYLKQPWELEAFSRQEILFRKAAEK